jgi:hypothetical protein
MFDQLSFCLDCQQVVPYGGTIGNLTDHQGRTEHLQKLAERKQPPYDDSLATRVTVMGWSPVGRLVGVPRTEALHRVARPDMQTSIGQGNLSRWLSSKLAAGLDASMEATPKHQVTELGFGTVAEYANVVRPLTGFAQRVWETPVRLYQKTAVGMATTLYGVDDGTRRIPARSDGRWSGATLGNRFLLRNAGKGAEKTDVAATSEGSLAAVLVSPQSPGSFVPDICSFHQQTTSPFQRISTHFGTSPLRFLVVSQMSPIRSLVLKTKSLRHSMQTLQMSHECSRGARDLRQSVERDH